MATTVNKPNGPDNPGPRGKERITPRADADAKTKENQ